MSSLSYLHYKTVCLRKCKNSSKSLVGTDTQTFFLFWMCSLFVIATYPCYEENLKMQDWGVKEHQSVALGWYMHRSTTPIKYFCSIFTLSPSGKKNKLLHFCTKIWKKKREDAKKGTGNEMKGLEILVGTGRLLLWYTCFFCNLETKENNAANYNNELEGETSAFCLSLSKTPSVSSLRWYLSFSFNATQFWSHFLDCCSEFNFFFYFTFSNVLQFWPATG